MVKEAEEVVSSVEKFVELLIRALDRVMVKVRETVELLTKVMVEVVVVSLVMVTVALKRVEVMELITVDSVREVNNLWVLVVMVVVGKVMGTKLVVTVVAVAITASPCTNVVNG